MGALPAKNAEVFMKSNSTSTILSGVRNWSMSTQRTSIDVSTIGDDWKKFILGQGTATGTCELLFDPSDTNHSAIETALWEGSTVTFYVRPEGSDVGKREYTVPAIISDWNISAATDDALTVSVSFQSTGEVTKGTVAQ